MLQLRQTVYRLGGLLQFPSDLNYFYLSQADQLFDPMSGEFRCTFCGNSVEEDEAAMPKKDSRLLLAKFNDQMEKLYDLLRNVEDVK